MDLNKLNELSEEERTQLAEALSRIGAEDEKILLDNPAKSNEDMESLLKEKKEKKKSIFRRIDWGWLVACLLFFIIAGLYAYDRYLVEQRLRVMESSSLALNDDRFRWISDNLTNHNDRINNLAGEVDVVKSAKDRIVVVPPEEKPDFATVKKDYSNVRSEPQMGDNTLRSLNTGKIVFIKNQIGEWYEIIEEGTNLTGFMHQSVLKF